MNFLAHHAVALQAAENGNAPLPPAYFVGVALPDLLSASGEGRLRNVPPADPSPLAQGAGLHLATDKRFHGLVSFADAQAEASRLLRTEAFSFPLRRVFFLAHVLVEIAFDGYLMQTRPNLAADFYVQFEQADLVSVVEETQDLLHATHPLLGLARTLEGFVWSRYLLHYDTWDGQAEAVWRVCRRARVPHFDAPDDRARLAHVLESFAPNCAEWAADFLTVP